MTINIMKKVVEVNGKEVQFTKKEYEIIELLATHPKQVFSKEQIFEMLWGLDSESTINTITEHIRRIRGKFSSRHFKFDFIKTVWGIGYKWQ
ncbi:winged helix-turn-helix domain-containing protein [Clostridium estertheticum]|uniref:winged helix-turn-helix domain-containing protein n=1 Tax=Clostridium estertheticum TaxID=238834 RepID=UPI0028150686|nr:winged helix-turn-helix domain-containing protein [Clostridium estertheticum]